MYGGVNGFVLSDFDIPYYHNVERYVPGRTVLRLASRWPGSLIYKFGLRTSISFFCWWLSSLWWLGLCVFVFSAFFLFGGRLPKRNLPRVFFAARLWLKLFFPSTAHRYELTSSNICVCLVVGPSRQVSCYHIDNPLWFCRVPAVQFLRVFVTAGSNTLPHSEHSFRSTVHLFRRQRQKWYSDTVIQWYTITTKLRKFF